MIISNTIAATPFGAGAVGAGLGMGAYSALKNWKKSAFEDKAGFSSRINKAGGEIGHEALATAIFFVAAEVFKHLALALGGTSGLIIQNFIWAPLSAGALFSGSALLATLGVVLASEAFFAIYQGIGKAASAVKHA